MARKSAKKAIVVRDVKTARRKSSKIVRKIRKGIKRVVRKVQPKQNPKRAARNPTRAIIQANLHGSNKKEYFDGRMFVDSRASAFCFHNGRDAAVTMGILRHHLPPAISSIQAVRK